MFKIITYLYVLITVSLIPTTSISTLSPQKILGQSAKSLESTHNFQNKSKFIGLPYKGLIKAYSNHFGVDYRLILAIIKQESQFQYETVSERGAYGLMQIMPKTGSEVTDQLDLPNISLPKDNLYAGIYYFSKLLTFFNASTANDRICLALAAYNAGLSRIYDAQELAAYIGEDPNTWRGIKSTLPLLSKRYYTLHRSVWIEGRPKSGNFGSWKQTLSYVDSVSENYVKYRDVLN